MTSKADTWKALSEPVHKGMFNCKHRTGYKECVVISRGKKECNCYDSEFAEKKYGKGMVADSNWHKRWEIDRGR